MNKRRIIRIAGGLLFGLILVIFLIIGLGNFALNRYLNADGRKDISKYLPINGKATYEYASIKLFRSFPDVTIQLEGLKLADELASTHKHPPLTLDKLNVRASVVELSQKHFTIEGIDLSGLTINLFDGKNGYSNTADLIRKKIKEKTLESTKTGVMVDYKNIDVHIANLKLNKIDEVSGQRVYATIDGIVIHNDEVDSRNQLTLEMNNIHVADEATNPKGDNPIQLDNAIVKVDLMTDYSRATLKEIRLNTGRIHFFNDSLGNSNFSALFGDANKSTTSAAGSTSKMSIAIDGTRINVEDLDFALVDQPKNKHIEARIVKFESDVQADADTTASIYVQLAVDQLGFNTQKGAYLRESFVQGHIQAKVSNGCIALASPTLLINEEAFDIRAALYQDKRRPTTLTIEKSDVQTITVKPLLTQSIQKSISAYDVEGPFYAKASIFFTPGKKDPRVEVDLRVDNKTVMAKGQAITNAQVAATFINRIYDDARQYSEDKRNVRLKIHDLSGEFNDFNIESQNALLTSTPNGGDRLIANANITGRAASVSKYLNHEKFNFQDGNFTLSTAINGSLNNLDDLLSGTNLNLSMQDLEVHYPEGNTVFPFRMLELSKQGEKTTFQFEGFTETHMRPFHIRGEVDRVEALLFPGRADRMQAKANIRASSVSWEGVVALFGKDGIMSSFKQADSKKAKRSMKQTLSGIEQSFHPVVSVAIDTVFYGKDLQLLNFNTGIKFEDERTLVLEETTFNVENSNITLDGQVKINQLDFTRFNFDIELNHLDFDALMPKFDYFGVHLIKQIHDQPDDLSMKIELSGELDDQAGLRPESIHADITYESHAEDKFTGSLRLNANPMTKKVDVVFGHSGHPRNFNHLLETDAYRFDKGWYTVSFNFDDNFKTLAQMVEESTFNLTIDDAEVYITDLDVTVPLTRIELASIHNKAYYYLLLRSDSLKQEVAFNGIVNNIRHFAFKDTDDPYEIELEISSPRIVWQDLKQLITYQKQDSSQGQNGRALKESITKVLTDFNPNVKLKIDRLEYSDRIYFNDIYAHAYLENEILKIDSANVAYGESQIHAHLNADMSHHDILPFDMGLHLINIDIGQTLKHFDYFNVSELREAKQLDGNIWLDLQMSAAMDLENQGFITNKSIADINVRLKDLVVEDLHTIDTITEGLNMEKRFKVLRFAPVESRLKVKGQRLEIRETEIQSNAIHAFVEGAIDKESPENLWISIPLKNIKKPDLEKVSNKTGYGAAGRKIYVQLISSMDDDNGKTKVHLRKKKFFQERFKAKQFRAYKRINRRARKAKGSPSYERSEIDR